MKVNTTPTDNFEGYDDGPESRQNWLAKIAGKPYTSIQEYPLYTDARVTGQAECGPYTFLNTVPLKQPATVQADIILRCYWHLGRWMPAVNWAKTDTRRYHGGDFPDEIASLSSLVLGVRLRPGGITRRFEEGGEPDRTRFDSGRSPLG